MRTLETGSLTIPNDLTERTHAGLGYRVIFRGETPLCDDGPETHARASDYMLKAAHAGKTVAWIGGGLCVGPSLFAMVPCTQTVYEIEAALVEYCPIGVTFIPGDYRDTLKDLFDVIVYDLAGDVPRDELEAHLNPGGKVLP